jgi:hypothetical protein
MMRGHELPAEDHAEQYAEFDDEIGRGELEGHGGDEVRTLAKERAGERRRGVGAGGGCRAERRGFDDGARRTVGKELGELGLGDDRFNDRGEKEAEAERPEDLPRHDAGHFEGFEGMMQHKCAPSLTISCNLMPEVAVLMGLQ